MGPVEYYWGPITLRSSNSQSRNLLFLTLQGLDRKTRTTTTIILDSNLF